MELSSYAELAVRLVNTESLGHEGGDQLTTLDGLRALVADREHLNHGVSRHELEALRQLRTEFRAFFVACSTPAQPARTITSASEIFLPPDCDALNSL